MSGRRHRRRRQHQRREAAEARAKRRHRLAWLRLIALAGCAFLAAAVIAVLIFDPFRWDPMERLAASFMVLLFGLVAAGVGMILAEAPPIDDPMASLADPFADELAETIREANKPRPKPRPFDPRIDGVGDAPGLSEVSPADIGDGPVIEGEVLSRDID